MRLKKKNVLIGQSSQNKSHSHTQQGTFTTVNTINTGNSKAKSLTGKFNGAQGGGSDLLSLTRGLGAYSGIFSASQVSTNFRISGTSESGTKYGLYIDATHRHQITLSGSTEGNGGDEARTENFTYRIWIRVA